MAHSPTYLIDRDEIVKLTCSGVLPIDADAELLALDAHVARAMRLGEVYSAQKLKALSNELHDLIYRHAGKSSARVIPFVPKIEAKVARLNPDVWPSGAA